MKYFTKEWYGLMQEIDYTTGYQPIEDKEYSDQEIDDLYKQALAKEIQMEESAYNSPPINMWASLLEDEDDFEPEYFLIEDPATGDFFHPETYDEAKAMVEKDFQIQMEEFEKRPPFDPSLTEDFFAFNYERASKEGDVGLPTWASEKLDKRLVALGYLPEPIFLKLEAKENEARLKFDAINNEAEKVLADQDISLSLLSKFFSMIPIS